MRTALLIRRRDFWIASLLAALCVILFLLSMNRILSATEQMNMFGTLLEAGSQSYRVHAGERCIGNITIELHENIEDFQVNLNGAIKVLSSGRVVDLALEVSGTFNILGQLGGGVLEITDGEHAIKVGLLDIDPIRVIVRSGPKGHDIKRAELAIPGPVELRRVRSRSYLISYRPLGSRPLPVAAALGGGLDLQIVKVGSRQEICEEREVLDLTPYVQSLQNSYGGIISFLKNQGVQLGLPS